MAEPARAPVAVVIVNWNSGDDLPRCVDSVTGQLGADDRLYVIDNGSTDGSLERLRALARSSPRVEVIELGANHGFCGGANAGIARREDRAVLVLNPDAWLGPGFLNRAMTHFARPEVGFVAGKVLRLDGITIDTAGQRLSPVIRKVIERGYGERDVGQFEVAAPVPSVCGAVALYAPRLLARLAPDGRLYDEDFFAFWEDADVGARATRAGFIGWYDPLAVAYHRRGGTRPRTVALLGRVVQLLGRDQAVQFHILKNRYLFLAKNESVIGLLARAPVFAVVDGAVLVLTAVTHPRVAGRLVRELPRLLARAWAKRGRVRS